MGNEKSKIKKKADTEKADNEKADTEKKTLTLINYISFYIID